MSTISATTTALSPKTKALTLLTSVFTSNWFNISKALLKLLTNTVEFWIVLYGFIFLRYDYGGWPSLNGNTRKKVQYYSLSLIFKLWGQKHYRSPSFQQDMIDNLKNVAIPGTGIPLSIFCVNYWVCLFFILFLNPLVCFFGAVNKAWIACCSGSSEGTVSSDGGALEVFVTNISDFYIAHLSAPDDWFSFWRLNCRMVSYHSLLTQSKDYEQEDKWTFLTTGKALNVPVSPYNEQIVSLVCKHKSIEGGMGIFFYENAAHGGNWIIQERLENAPWLNDLLPPNAPLSTMRVITTSKWSLLTSSSSAFSSTASSTNTVKGGATGLQAVLSAAVSGISLDQYLEQERSQEGSYVRSGFDTDEDDEVKTEKTEPIHKTEKTKKTEKTEKEVKKEKGYEDYIHAESALLRLGRSGAATDHSSVLFDVDIASSTIQKGTTNMQWYQLGLNKARQCPWLPPAERPTHHPDAPKPLVAGKVIPNLHEALEIVKKAHFTMMKDVPIVGWDVAFTTQDVCLLEVNLSCNFFKGSFDIPRYIKFVDAQFAHLHALEQQQQQQGLQQGQQSNSKKVH